MPPSAGGLKAMMRARVLAVVIIALELIGLAYLLLALFGVVEDSPVEPWELPVDAMMTVVTLVAAVYLWHGIAIGWMLMAWLLGLIMLTMLPELLRLDTVSIGATGVGLLVFGGLMALLRHAAFC